MATLLSWESECEIFVKQSAIAVAGGSVEKRVNLGRSHAWISRECQGKHRQTLAVCANYHIEI
ncbi:MAG: hypothetical protein QF368_14540 [SAR202 cluster bacterium]|jgi:hypothetical protein|nr:hypothetical protein [SAR202 cluster bacterium]